MVARDLRIFALTLAFFLIHFFGFGQRQKRVIGCWSGLDSNITLYADSLNFITDRGRLPKFLQDYLIDWKLKDALIDCLQDRDEAISLRFAVLSRVVNESALRWVVESNDPIYDSIYQPEKLEMKTTKGLYHSTYPTLPFMKYSIRQLAKLRLEEIARIRKKFSGK